MMSTNEEYKQYMSQMFAQEDDVLRNIRAVMEHEGIPGINVSANGGKTLHLLALMIGAKRILEIGTLGGYSATWMARAMPANGRLITLELDPHHAEVSRRNLAKAGLADRVEVRVGPANETLRTMQRTNEPPFDVVFIDADKTGYPEYLTLVLPLIREGGLVLADNTLGRRVLGNDKDDAIVQYNTAVAAHPDLVSMMLPMLQNGGGVDGILVSMKRAR
ncbi:MAG: O-methyltransferase [Chloroflexota bacterium]